MPNHARQFTKGYNLIFLHSSLDDAGLNSSEFRVLAHLSRRASDGKAWPGIDSISKICHLSRRTVISSIQSLESRKMVICKRNPGVNTVYWLTDPERWVISPVQNKERLPVQNEERSSAKWATLPVQNEERKVIQEGNPKKDVGAMDAPGNKICDSDWLENLKSDMAYFGIDIVQQYARMVHWCSENRKQPSRKRFVNWLNRCEMPIGVQPISTTQIKRARWQIEKDRELVKNRITEVKKEGGQYIGEAGQWQGKLTDEARQTLIKLRDAEKRLNSEFDNAAI